MWPMVGAKGLMGHSIPHGSEMGMHSYSGGAPVFMSWAGAANP